MMEIAGRRAGGLGVRRRDLDLTWEAAPVQLLCQMYKQKGGYFGYRFARPHSGAWLHITLVLAE